jgi:23S rRNA pseudouridine1911/1915/1917 synthase
MDESYRLTADGKTRLDKYVCAGVPELSRTQVQRLIAAGNITVNGQAAKPGHRLSTGDNIDITIPPTPPQE